MLIYCFNFLSVVHVGMIYRVGAGSAAYVNESNWHRFCWRIPNTMAMLLSYHEFWATTKAATTRQINDREMTEKKKEINK